MPTNHQSQYSQLVKAICSKINAHQHMASATKKASCSIGPKFNTASSRTTSKCSNNRQARLHQQGNMQQQLFTISSVRSTNQLTSKQHHKAAAPNITSSRNGSY
ncbi:hypothetical protein Nepgr_014742 [Nepenthes gracilis]|uniref:Uncharacterized protein n=1 Tax=Nepenthes gracilis TaxID=150966 RepID=A0AAD3XQM5_NEPGR|nr:hypothetical protein Nepgr_014742 [Nepenthes gracilis]